ncbi:major facilitator superfamily domain-containing protein [Talaromyces proteolyticus]|uniref:Major facilitator superfamily domain-containing protein n=1 Tax=Talaromyces proteolyticus TaxID=1131652 RepID=A0AAD4Q3A6_9EURO|nr:major facilitator superfamily domain-containing protein [Talaromyces proteolyticus]KAH8704874.1 major facilitator superfamily domain-containing protein [Talaromyces proteolyticus]
MQPSPYLTEGTEADLMREKNQDGVVADSLSLPRESLFLFTICMAQFMTLFGLGQTLGILHNIGDSLAIANSGELSWLVAGYSLTAGTFILVAGRVGDCFGYKNMFLAGMLWTAIWSMISGVSVYANATMLIIARVFQGIGPAFLLPNSLAILGVSYSPGPRKNMAFALFGACAPLGGAAGFIFTALFALTWWPWSFLSTAIALVVFTVLAAVVIPPLPASPHRSKSLLDKLQMLDLPGATTGVAALVLINVAWNQAPSVGWKEPYIPVILALGIICVAVFFLIERRFAPMPLIPFAALTVDILLLIGCVACGWACFGVWVYYVCQFIQELKGASPLLLAAYMSPVAVSGTLASVAVGLLLHLVAPSWIMTFSLTCFTVGSILLATAPVDQTYWAQLFCCMLIIPWGMDTSFPAATVIFSNTVAAEHQGMGASLIATTVNYSISLGLGIAATVERYVKNGDNTEADQLKGYRGALYTGIGFAGLGIILSLAMVMRGLHKSRNTSLPQRDSATCVTENC